MAANNSVDRALRFTALPLPPWFLALLWLAVLGPFFFLSYGFANTVASQRAYVPSIVFGWEHRVPFLPWTIVPYWTSDLLYAVSLLMCTTRKELHIQVKRLVAAQLISVACFLLFPLRSTFERPETHGFFGWLFDVLLGFDKPFNQAPSLHVSLAVILWSRFSAHLTGVWRTAMAAWLTLVALSTMTTYQHQFLDLPTGALAGLLVIALIPDGKFAGRVAQRFRQATFYSSGSVLLAAFACKFGGVAWILLWPSTAMLVAAAAHLADWPGAYRHTAVRLIAAPYLRAAWLNSRWWTRRENAAHEIVDGVWLGRAPGGSWTNGSIVNVAAEFPVHLPGVACKNIAMLDLVSPTRQQLEEGVAAIEGFAGQRPTLVCCALGYSRSASVVSAWLLSTGRATSADEAAVLIRRRRPRAVLDEVGSARRV